MSKPIFKTRYSKSMAICTLMIVIYLSSACGVQVEGNNNSTLIGSYYSACDDQGSNNYRYKKFEITVNEIKVTTTLHNNSNSCSDSSVYQTEIEKFTYTYDSTTLIYKTISKSVAANTSAQVLIFNNNIECSFNDWSIDLAKDITNQDCTSLDDFDSEVENTEQPVSNVNEYTIFGIKLTKQ